MLLMPILTLAAVILQMSPFISNDSSFSVTFKWCCIVYILFVFKSLNETVPWYMYGKASFSCYAPRVWNKLPAHIKLLLLIVLRNNNTVFHDLAFNCFLSFFNTIVFSCFFILSLGFIANVCLFLYLISCQFNFKALWAAFYEWKVLYK